MFDEGTVENLYIGRAIGMGWEYVEAENVPRYKDSVLVEQWLMEALVRLNPITEEQAEQVIFKLRATIMSCHDIDSLVEANSHFRNLIYEENTYPFGKDGDFIPIRFFSDNDDENHCVVTNQWEFPRASVDGGKRLDLVFLINGIPLVVGEVKSATRQQVTWADGAVDLLNYQKSIIEMFVRNILTFASEG